MSPSLLYRAIFGWGVWVLSLRQFQVTDGGSRTATAFHQETNQIAVSFPPHRPWLLVVERCGVERLTAC
jgi:hypothetical protein